MPEPTQTEIRQAGFELIQVPQTKKNAVDQAITISAINVYHQSHYNEFFLISADGDFTALLMDLKNKGIKISIIARRQVSKDLTQYCSEQFYLTSNGYIFKSILKERENIIDTIEKSMQDALNALKNLIQRQADKSIQIFSFEEWKSSFLDLESHDVPPLILGQLISPEELFQIFIKSHGYGHTSDFNFLCIHPSDKIISIKELKVDEQIPNVKKIRIPIRTIPKISNKDLITEFGIDENFTIDKIQENNGDTIINDKVVEKSIKKIGSIDTNSYTNEIAKVFRDLVKNKKSPGEVKLTNLNTSVCESLGIPTSKKIYKTCGFKTFTKAIEAAKGNFARTVKIKKDLITY
ncbi:MAG TPA: NYN domain-containing protein [archaeon]|nr:NYN domain-containing protein [archaeon]